MIPVAAVLPWGAAHHPLERFAESTFGFVAKRKCYGKNRFGGSPQAIPGKQHPPSRQVLHWAFSYFFLEFEGKDRA